MRVWPRRESSRVQERWGRVLQWSGCAFSNGCRPRSGMPAVIRQEFRSRPVERRPGGTDLKWDGRANNPPRHRTLRRYPVRVQPHGPRLHGWIGPNMGNPGSLHLPVPRRRIYPPVSYLSRCCWRPHILSVGTDLAALLHIFVDRGRYLRSRPSPRR